MGVNQFITNISEPCSLVYLKATLSLVDKVVRGSLHQGLSSFLQGAGAFNIEAR